MPPPTDPPAFPLGVASFDPLTDRVLLWTALGGQGTCRWEVATDEAFPQVVASGPAEAREPTGMVTVDATGLQPGTTYWFRFVAADGTRSRTGRTRTLPGAGADRLRIGALCCARYGQSRFTAYRAVAAADVDLVVHLGDYVYEDAKGDCEGREPDPPHNCVTLDDYRARHAQARRDPDARALHAAHPMVVIWDDHDIADNAWRDGAKGHDPETQGDWHTRRDTALRVHQEFLPKRLADPDDLTAAWRRLDAGDLLALVCTEGRAHRDEQAGMEGAPAADDPARTLLGPVQARWLDEAAADPGPRWVVVVSGTVVSELVIEAPDALDRVLPEKYAIVDGCATNTDQWDGYVADRRRLAGALARRAGGALVLSGDIHSSWAIEGPLGPDGVPVAVELVCPPAATTPLGQLLPPGVGRLLAPVLVEQVPGVRWAEVDHRGFLTVDIGRDRAEAAWWWVDPDGDETPASPARRWSIPWVPPMGLIDPEPRPHPTSKSPRSPMTEVRRSRRWRLVGAMAAAGAAAAAAAGVAVRLVSRRR